MDTWLKQICSDKTSVVLAFAESRIGGREENQDSYDWADTKFGYLLTVCDGMGGGPGGKTASTIAVNEIISGIKDGMDDSSPGNVIIKAIQRANMAILNAVDELPHLKGMGSTATVLLINEDSAWIAHVGDSRVYQLRNGRKVFRTFDHSLVFEMVSKGVITEEQARLSAQSNIITRALGIKPEVEVDIKEVPYLKGDRFVLTTDGIHGTMPESELIKRCVKRKTSIGVIVDDIATYVDNLGRGFGSGHDNLTLAIVETTQSSKLKTKMTKRSKILFGSLICICLISVLFNIYQARTSSDRIEGVITNSTSPNHNVELQDSKIKEEPQTEIIESQEPKIKVEPKNKLITEEEFQRRMLNKADRSLNGGKKSPVTKGFRVVVVNPNPDDGSYDVSDIQDVRDMIYTYNKWKSARVVELEYDETGHVTLAKVQAAY